MARLLADENLPVAIVHVLRSPLGHDVTTVRESCDSKTGDAVADEQVLEFARTQNRTVVTRNVKDFKRLHEANPGHRGIIACSFSDKEPAKSVARRIDQKIKEVGERHLQGQFHRVSRIPV